MCSQVDSTIPTLRYVLVVIFGVLIFRQLYDFLNQSINSLNEYGELDLLEQGTHRTWAVRPYLQLLSQDTVRRPPQQPKNYRTCRHARARQ